MNRWPRQGHQKLLLGIVRYSFQACDAPDLQQRNIARANSKAPSGQRVSQLVKDYDGKECNDQCLTIDHVRHALSRQVVADSQPNQQNQKGSVHVDIDPEKPTDAPGPLHLFLLTHGP